VQRTGKLPQHPPISVSLIQRACGETFLHMLWHFSACAFRPRVSYNMQRLSHPPHMSHTTLRVAAAVAFPVLRMQPRALAIVTCADGHRARRADTRRAPAARLHTFGCACRAGEAVGGAARVRIRPGTAT
jgi:hypothetical protein